MSRRYLDWLRQSQRDLKAARDSLQAENFEWTAFQAQQSAEKALKALIRFHNHDARGHTLVHLLKELENFSPIPENMWVNARELDRHYIQPRYPNGFDSGYPGEFYDRVTADRTIAHAEEFLQFVEDQLD